MKTFSEINKAKQKKNHLFFCLLFFFFIVKALYNIFLIIATIFTYPAVDFDV